MGCSGPKSKAWLGRLAVAALCAAAVTVWPARGQDPLTRQDDTSQGLNPDVPKELTELDKLAETYDKAKKKAQRPPFQFMRNQVAPFDVLPWIKGNHWSTLTLEVRANNQRYEGIFQSVGDIAGKPQVPLLDTPRAMIYRRDALLPADQDLSRSMQIMLPSVPKRLFFELTRPGSIRPDAAFEALLQRLEPHQMLLPILASEPGNYNNWAKMLATVPASGDAESSEIERQRYYRLVLPLEPNKPNLSPHPLTWTTTSHVLWDGLTPESLSRGTFSQQQAMIDWLHWGGQLIVVAVGPRVAALEESFLAPYLPATVKTQSDTLNSAALQHLADSYPPPLSIVKYPEYQDGLATPPRYTPAVPIEPPSNQPLLVARLEPKSLPGVTPIPLGDVDNHLLAVEWRVGRGRVTMLAVNPSDSTLRAWEGLDSFVRRLILRRPEEEWTSLENRHAYAPLSGPQLSWVRIASRDIGAMPGGNERDPNEIVLPTDLQLSTDPVAAWIDTTADFPKRTRDTLERASGITIPGAGFVLKVILAYIIALVPVNWFVSRFLFRRREVAWIVAPLLALGFAYGVERAAAVDMGFDVARDEIDLIELQGTYPRAHVSRFTSLYSSGRVNFSISEPDNPTSLILPMRAYQSLRGEEIRYSAYESSGDPTLADFLVQPRSLAMFRTESLVDLGGGIALEGDATSGRIVNGTSIELRDAVLVDVDRDRVMDLGTIGAWPADSTEGKPSKHVVELSAHQWAANKESPMGLSLSGKEAWSDAATYLELLRSYRWKYASERGELRLVAWARDASPGLQVSPRVDRTRGVRLVVAHLKFDVPRDDAQPYYTPAAKKSAAIDGPPLR